MEDGDGRWWKMVEDGRWYNSWWKMMGDGGRWHNSWWNNLGQKIGDKFTKLSKIDFSKEWPIKWNLQDCFAIKSCNFQYSIVVLYVLSQYYVRRKCSIQLTLGNSNTRKLEHLVRSNKFVGPLNLLTLFRQKRSL